jgi:hypothetical protein
MAESATVASSSFAFDAWEEDRVVDDNGALIAHTHFRKRFEGDLDGTSIGEMVMLHIGGNPTAYSGFERVVGTMHGRTGSFVLFHQASAGLEGGLSITVVPGSGTDGLAGLKGSARIEVSGHVGDTQAPHRVIFEYELA